MSADRRRSQRFPSELLVNKFIDGRPHAARLVEISASGCVLERLFEPEVRRDLYPLEIGLPRTMGGTRLWLWGRKIRQETQRTVLEFVGLDAVDRATLARLAETCTV